MRDFGPLVYGSRWAEEFRADLLGQSEGDAPILGRGIVSRDRQQPRSLIEGAAELSIFEGILLRRERRWLVD